MQRFAAAHFVQLSRLLTIFDSGSHPDKTPLNDIIEGMREILPVVRSDCFDMGMRASTVTLDRLLDMLSSSTSLTYGAVRPLFRELQGRLVDEMSSTVYLSLSLKEAEHYERWWEGWETALARFPTALRDIEEMRKCFALARYSAAVFHSVKVVETGLIELGTFIQVKDPRSGWTAVAQELSRIVKKPYADRRPFEKKHFEFLEQLQGTIEALKNAWRNKISHAQGSATLMSTEFTSEIAEEIILATRAFMRRLADGLPPAAP